MNKVFLSDGSGRWFDMDSARKFGADSFIDNSGKEVCRATDGIRGLWEHLYITMCGTFILVRTYDSPHPNPDAECVAKMDIKSAVKWLITNGHQDDVKKLDLESEESQLEL